MKCEECENGALHCDQCGFYPPVQQGEVVMAAFDEAKRLLLEVELRLLRDQHDKLLEMLKDLCEWQPSMYSSALRPNLLETEALWDKARKLVSDDE